MKAFGVLLVAALFLTRINGAIPEVASSVIHVPSKDGTSIAVECAGTGPDLVIVHGGIGDRTRWKPLFPLLASRFTVCAMDRRGHGESGDAPDYTGKRS
jgi:pimeloyl-ACP methyl ester carboxylesterase